MEGRFPKRIFGPGEEPQVDQINNSCKLSLLKLLEEKLPVEYNDVSTNSVFADVLALRRNNLGYSARLVHNMLCKQLITTKQYELWFVFGGMPLRFSQQEFHAVSGLNCSGDAFAADPEYWKDDKGFWAEVLNKKTKINIVDIKMIYLDAAKTWEPKDRLRLVYLCVIADFVLAKDEKSYISHTYIQLVMDINKVRDYPWGRESFTLLIESIEKASGSLKNPNYVLNGFSYAFQIWVMEAVPVIGSMLGKLVKDNPLDGPRCCRWTGCCRVRYDELINLENTFADNDVVYPYISTTGNADMFQSAAYLWSDVDDATVDELNLAIGKRFDFRKHVWDIMLPIKQDEAPEVNAASVNVHETKKRSREFPDVGESGMKKRSTEFPDVDESRTKKRSREVPDVGAENRKSQLLYQRMVGSQACLEEQMKTFIQASFTSLHTYIEKNFVDRLGKIEADLVEVKQLLSKHDVATSSMQDIPATSKQKKGRTYKPPKKPVQTKTRAKTKVENFPSVPIGLDDIFTSQTSELDGNLNTQEYLTKKTSHLSQDTYVSGFDSTPNEDKLCKEEELELEPCDKTFSDALDLMAKVCRGSNNDDWLECPLMIYDDDAMEIMTDWSTTWPK